jgi:glycosyltransferase involved in cell wall biosynthesis
MRYLDNLEKNANSIGNILNVRFKKMYLKRIKRKYVKNHVIITAITEVDKKYIRQSLRRNPIVTVPNGVNISIEKIEKDYTLQKLHAKSILFLGSLDYLPNIESILFSIKNIMPKVWIEEPETMFLIVGRNPIQEILNLQRLDSRIKVYMDVEDVGYFYKLATLFLGPIFSGSGMKNKFLEALSYGTPLITNNEGAVGINIEDESHGYICKNSYEMIKAVIEILHCCVEKYHAMSTKCFDLAKDYSWGKAGEIVSNIIENGNITKCAR